VSRGVIGASQGDHDRDDEWKSVHRPNFTRHR